MHSDWLRSCLDSLFSEKQQDRDSDDAVTFTETVEQRFDMIAVMKSGAAVAAQFESAKTRPTVT